MFNHCRAIAGVVSVAVLLLTACRDLPRDPEETLKKTRGNVVMVGVTSNPPWIIRHGDEAAGIEADLVRGFARQIGARVEWVWGPEETNFEALAKFELQMVAAGVTDSTPWKSKVALTRPYVTTRDVVARDSTAPPVTTLKELEITIAQGQPTASALTKEGARLKRVDTLGRGPLYVAGPRAEVVPLGYVPFQTLKTDKRVLAVPPGENAFLCELERYLSSHREAIARSASEEVK